jgi:hypothetical protein
MRPLRLSARPSGSGVTIQPHAIRVQCERPEFWGLVAWQGYLRPLVLYLFVVNLLASQRRYGEARNGIAVGVLWSLWNVSCCRPVQGRAHCVGASCGPRFFTMITLTTHANRL